MISSAYAVLLFALSKDAFVDYLARRLMRSDIQLADELIVLAAFSIRDRCRSMARSALTLNYLRICMFTDER